MAMEVLSEGLRAKFQQSDRLRKLLLMTGDFSLVKLHRTITVVA
jgi:predicted NAD-dependent protein-ADP-ribosyltransferase YbiA (DUF1768 family)